MKIVAIICPVIRHKYVFNIIANNIKIDGIIIQHRIRKEVTIETMTNEEKIRNKRHFDDRDIAEMKWFGGTGQILSTKDSEILEVHNNSLDLPEVEKFIDKISPNIIITLGCGLVGQNIIDKIDYGLNFHLGMSPRYRGSAGFFWPLYNMDPERIAISILKLEGNIDGGPIVHHSRPILDENDKIHDIACKTIISGAKDFAEILRDLYDGKTLIAKPQKIEGRVYYEAAYHPRHLKVVDYLISDGLIKEYLNNKDERDKYVHMVRYPRF